MYNCQVIFKSCPVLTPNESTTDEDVSKGLRDLYLSLDEEINPSNKFVMFSSEFTRKYESKLKHLRAFLENLNHGSEIAQFDMIQLAPMNKVDPNSIAYQKPVIYYPSNVWINLEFDLSFQFTLFNITLLRKIIQKILITETIPYITSTEIMPIAYSLSCGLLRYAVDYNNDFNGFEIPDRETNEIVQFHKAYISDERLIHKLLREYSSCSLL